MRWRKRDREDEPGESEATRARIRAERDLAQRRAEGHRVRSILNEWSRIQEENNIAANLRASVKGGRS